MQSPDGAFYTSQDADLVEGKHSAGYFARSDAARRKIGIPRVDKHVYARENGWAITGLVALYAATGDRPVLDDALRSAKGIVANRSNAVGGFRHGSSTTASGLYLGDTVAMERAFLALYGATGDRQWLTKAESAMRFIEKNFRAPNDPGFVTVKNGSDHLHLHQPDLFSSGVRRRKAGGADRQTSSCPFRQ